MRFWLGCKVYSLELCERHNRSKYFILRNKHFFLSKWVKNTNRRSKKKQRKEGEELDDLN